MPNESPSSWPAAALEAQAVAARTYAITSNVGGRGFDQYADTRSQVYRGYLSETPSTGPRSRPLGRGGDLWREGRHDVLLLDLGWLHGGQRERLHGCRRAALAARRRGPLRRLFALPPMGPVHIRPRASPPSSAAGCGGASRASRAPAGSLTAGGPRGGARICGNTVVTGPQLRARMGLRDTWFYVRRVTTQRHGGAEARTLRGARPLVALDGIVDGTQRDSVTLERRKRRRLDEGRHLPRAEGRIPHPRRDGRALTA